MKTPKRDIMPLFQLEGGHRLYKGKEHEYFRLGFFPATASRWKRKNRIAQYKRTIARQAEEIEHLRTLLTLHIQEEYLGQQKAALEWAAKHISAHIHQAETTTEWEDSGPVTYLHCPLPTITYNRSTGLLVPTTPKET